MIDMVKAKGGATMTELTQKTGWMPHSIRGFASGTFGKKMGPEIDSSKDDKGERRRRISVK